MSKRKIEEVDEFQSDSDEIESAEGNIEEECSTDEVAEVDSDEAELEENSGDETENNSDEELEEDSDDDELQHESCNEEVQSEESDIDENPGSAPEDDLDIDEEVQIESNQPLKLLTKLEKKSTEKRKKPGIIYLSRIPVNMSVTKLRVYMGHIGPVGRIFLRAKEKGGNKRRKSNKFLEGWVEFLKKRHARNAADLLNSKPVGGKKKFAGHDELWNIQYLPRFKWEYLGYQKEHDLENYKHRMSENIKKVLKDSDKYAQAAEKVKLDKIVDERERKRESKKAQEAVFSSVFA